MKRLNSWGILELRSAAFGSLLGSSGVRASISPWLAVVAAVAFVFVAAACSSEQDGGGEAHTADSSPSDSTDPASLPDTPSDSGGAGAEDTGLIQPPSDVDGTPDEGEGNSGSEDSGAPQEPGNGQLWTLDPAIIGIESVTPPGGTSDGGELVMITGYGFTPDSKIYFGSALGRFPYISGGDSILVETPPHKVGTVDVRVQRADGVAAVATAGYTFISPIEVHAVEPPQGPAAGGTPVVVHGRGFGPDSIVLFGGVPGISTKVVGDTRLECLTPTGAAGPALVQVASAGGFGSLAGGYVFLSAPVVTKLSPLTGPAAGGTDVVVQGAALGSGTIVRVGGQIAELLSATPNQLTFRTPGGPVGPASVEFENSFGLTRLSEGFVYLGGLSSAPTVWAVLPGKGSAAGGEAVSVIVQGFSPSPGDAPQVRFGAELAALKAAWDGGPVISVETPALPGPGAVDVEVVLGAQTAVLSAGFVATLPLLAQQILPATGPSEGGTPVVISGAGFQPGAMEVRFGPLPGTELMVVDGETITCRTPPGSIGSVDVTVRRGSIETKVAGGFSYYPPEKIAVYALAPNQGSMAGGTYVEIYGAGFEEGALVWFGDLPASDVTVISPGRIGAYTPAQGVSTVDVTVVSGGLARTLAGAYSYFNPASSFGGTWGKPVTGAVNVTVRDNATGLPVAEATVIAGTGDGAEVKLTDENGQVTFSGPGLVGPVQINAHKAGYSTYGVVSFDAENVTVFLQPEFPPTPGNPNPPTPVSPPQVRGKVLGFDKYVIAPPTDCDDIFDASQPTLCKSCSVDADCAEMAGGICAQLWQPGPVLESRCTLSCAAATDCPVGYVCAPNSAGPRCQPALPSKTAYCVISKDSMFSVQGNPGPGNFVDAEGYYQINSRSGVVAVICYGGYLAKGGVFTPTIMGVRRYVYTQPNTLHEDQDVELTIPLDRRLRARYDQPPVSPAGTQAPDLRISLELDGDDGYIDMPRKPVELMTSADANQTYTFLYYPKALTGPLFSAKYAFYTAVFGKDTPNPPFSVSLLRLVKSIHGPSTLIKPQEMPWKLGPQHIEQDLFGVWAASDDFVVGVGPKGTVVVGSPLGWGAQSVPTTKNLHAVWGTSAASVWAVGAEGTILYFDGVKWAQQPSPVNFDLISVHGSGPQDVWAAGTGGLVRFDGANWEFVPVDHAVNLTSVRLSAEGVGVVTGGDGRVLVREAGGWVATFAAEGLPLLTSAVDSSGWLWAAGPQGRVLSRAPGPNSAWVERPVPSSATIRSLLAPANTAEGTVWAAGDGGALFRWTGAAWVDESMPSSRVDVRALAESPAGTLYAMGAYAFPIGPFLPFPELTYPVFGQPFPKDALSWKVPALTPNYTSVTLADATNKPFWQLIVDGAVGGVALPSFQDLADLDNYPPQGMIRFGMTHILSNSSEPFDINQYTTLDFNLFRRLSWSNRQGQFN